MVGQRRQKLPVAVLDFRLPFILAVSHFQHFAGRHARQPSADAFQLHDRLMNPVLHEHQLRRIQPGQNTVPFQEG